MPIQFKQHVAPNGLRILAEVDPDAHTAAAGFFVRTGARDEHRSLMGVSHFLEHMMFKGTGDLSAEELNRRFDEMGARNNAYTSSEVTCFYAHVLPERLPEAVDLLARMLRPALRQEDFDREKQVILEEIAMYKDEPMSVLFESVLEAHYGGHPLSHRVLGTDESITAMTAEQMRAYFDRRYSADNTVVALAGRVDFDAAVRQIEGLCAAWSPTRPGRDTAAPKAGGGPVELRDAKVTRAYLVGLAPAPAMADDRRYAAMLLAQVLGAADNSRLHWSLIETGIAEEASAGFDPHDGCGDFWVYLTCDPARADEAWTIAMDQVERLADSVTPDDLVRLRNKLATAATLGGERPADRMQRLGRQWTALGRYTTLEQELDCINRVTLEDVRAVARDFPMRPVTVGRLLPP